MSTRGKLAFPDIPRFGVCVDKRWGFCGKGRGRRSSARNESPAGTYSVRSVLGERVMKATYAVLTYCADESRPR